MTVNLENNSHISLRIFSAQNYIEFWQRSEKQTRLVQEKWVGRVYEMLLLHYEATFRLKDKWCTNLIVTGC